MRNNVTQRALAAKAGSRPATTAGAFLTNAQRLSAKVNLPRPWQDVLRVVAGANEKNYMSSPAGAGGLRRPGAASRHWP